LSDLKEKAKRAIRGVLPRARQPHEEVVGEKNERQLATLTPEAWHGLVVLRARSAFFDMDALLDEVEHPTEGLIHEALQMSGAIGGEHRKDIVESLRATVGGATNPGLSLPININPQAAPAAPPTKKRGL